eukprot:gnl/TRDRNA2_/TRDRNA2_155278_c3_seq5.p1 gnl/TRDRNA2_/TRDRNA2_155278_c3~~gnl/TRDRNA2_/TRDRNA2_155278_c3_seq5.p1  ORF type:complete len:465 (+),score=81.14 gnl/TRDRNA2_/TRDRNA2_155278_c3_seq5:542-1936(+)
MLDQIQKAFVAGNSMVINSLQSYSEAARRLVSALNADLGWPIDAYMYLTPPHSKSYGLHYDVMDAWMLQIAGSKHWTVCNPRRAGFSMSRRENKHLQCSNLTMKGGDVMYVPFGTMHVATTSNELSSHLTVNVERQCFVWGNIFRAAATYAMIARAGDEIPAPWEYLDASRFVLEGETDAERWLLQMMSQVDRLAYTPLSGPDDKGRLWGQVLARGASSADVPAGYWPALQQEWQSLVADFRRAVGNSKWSTVTWKGHSEEIRIEDIGDEALRWALNVARLHSIRHLQGDVWFSVSSFESLAALRHRDHDASGSFGMLQSMQDSLKRWTGDSASPKDETPALQFVRQPGARLLLLEHAGKHHMWLGVGKGKVISKTAANAMFFACGLYHDGSSRGQLFSAAEVPWSEKAGDDAKQKLLLELVKEGALEIRDTASEHSSMPNTGPDGYRAQEGINQKRPKGKLDL